MRKSGALMRRIAFTGILLVFLFGLVSTGAEDEPLQGFTRANSATEREWEAKFRAIPSPDNQREYMRRLSARPHHVGSPYDKENAEWILSKFKEWGWDAQDRNIRSAFSHAERARAGDGRAHALHGEAAGAAALRRSHVATSRASNCPPTTPTRSMATSPRRWSSSIMACPRITKSSTAWAFP